MSQGDNYLERFLAYHRPAGTEPASVAVDYLNRLCDGAYGGTHRYTVNDLGKWRRHLAGAESGAQRPPQKVIDVIRAELLTVALLDLGEDYAANLCAYIGLPALPR